MAMSIRNLNFGVWINMLTLQHPQQTLFEEHVTSFRITGRFQPISSFFPVRGSASAGEDDSDGRTSSHWVASLWMVGVDHRAAIFHKSSPPSGVNGRSIGLMNVCN